MIRVSYNGLVADVRDEHLKQGIDFLSAESDQSRAQILKSVEAALQNVLESIEQGKTLSPETMQNTANDICLWFAGETVAGRAEEYKAVMQ